MNLTIFPTKLQGIVPAIPSKSQAHRLLICAAFADKPTLLRCPATNRDIEATAACLRALGARIERDAVGYFVVPIVQLPKRALLPCGESGSTLRFLLPIACALGIDTVFQMEGRLPQRPLSPLWEELERMGARLTRPGADTLRCQGRLRSGEYTMDGGVSSQFITGLLFALSLLPDGGSLRVTGRIESRPYIEMTVKALAHFGVCAEHYTFCGKTQYKSPGTLTVEGDWSNAAFFLTAQALGSDLKMTGLDPASAQGDRAIADLLPLPAPPAVIDGADIPDLIPVLAVAAGAENGAVFTNIGRLRLKESDRVAAVTGMITALGGHSYADENTLTVEGTGYRGGTVDACGDHRIAMAAAVAATVCAEPVTILGAQCVEKSYPAFWEEYRCLGGQYEQPLR